MNDEDKKALEELLDKYGYQEVLSEIASQAGNDGHEDFATDLDDLSFEAP